MLISYRTGVCALAAALSFSAGAASADNVEVLINDGSYFPSVIYANKGDNIIFRNVSDAVHVINGPEESWTSGNIAPEATYRLNLTHATPLTFASEDGEAVGEIIRGN